MTRKVVPAHAGVNPLSYSRMALCTTCPCASGGESVVMTDEGEEMEPSPRKRG